MSASISSTQTALSTASRSDSPPLIAIPLTPPQTTRAITRVSNTGVVKIGNVSTNNAITRAIPRMIANSQTTYQDFLATVPSNLIYKKWGIITAYSIGGGGTGALVGLACSGVATPATPICVGVGAGVGTIIGFIYGIVQANSMINTRFVSWSSSHTKSERAAVTTIIREADTSGRFICPISEEVMSQPIKMRCCGKVYNLTSVEPWLADHDTCPNCRAKANKDDMLSSPETMGAMRVFAVNISKKYKAEISKKNLSEQSQLERATLDGIEALEEQTTTQAKTCFTMGLEKLKADFTLGHYNMRQVSSTVTRLAYDLQPIVQDMSDCLPLSDGSCEDYECKEHTIQHSASSSTCACSSCKSVESKKN